MEILASTPYLLRILVSLACILLFQRLTRNLALAMTAGILVLGVWAGHGAGAIAEITLARLSSLDTVILSLVVVGVIWLSTLMSEAGIMKDLVACLKTRLSRRTMLAALPAVVGLLPMPAGALFSAPLVDDADDARLVPPLFKAQINYWFRHIWEFWWPLYPGVLLAVDMSGLGIFTMVGLMFPLFFASFLGGYLFLLRKVPNSAAAPRDPNGKSFTGLVLPILTVIGVYGVLLVVAPGLARINKYLPMAAGVLCGLAVIQLQRPLSGDVWRKVVFSRKIVGLLLIVVLARVYGAFVESRLADGTFLMERIRAELFVYGIPAVFLVALIPFVSGLTTGITIGYIGASFPVVLSLAGPTTGELFSTIVLGYSCGYIGMMLSPIHVCLIVTNEYFKVGLANSLAGLVRPALTLLALAICYSLAWLAV